jgi:hypothetical protein
MFDWVIAPQSATTLYVYRVGRSCPCWSWKPNKSRAKIQLKFGLQSLDPVKPPGHPGLTARVTWRSFGSHISHPDYELVVLYMDLDLLDETYPMGKSKLPFKDFVQGGLTGLAQTCHFWVSKGTTQNYTVLSKDWNKLLYIDKCA